MVLLLLIDSLLVLPTRRLQDWLCFREWFEHMIPARYYHPVSPRITLFIPLS